MQVAAALSAVDLRHTSSALVRVENMCMIPRPSRILSAKNPALRLSTSTRKEPPAAFYDYPRVRKDTVVLFWMAWPR